MKSNTVSKARTDAAVPSRRKQIEKVEKAFEWSEEDIAAVAYGEKPVVVAKIGDDMESKIARVQLRKKEAEERRNRLAAAPTAPPKPPSVLDNFVMRKGATSPSMVAQVLNEHFMIQTQNDKLLVNNVFPLHCFDNGVHDELLGIPSFGENGTAGVCLVGSESPEMNDSDSIGKYFCCTILGISDSNSDYFDVSISSSDCSVYNRDVILRMHRCYVYSLEQNLSKYGLRVEDALKRRKDCTSLMKYHWYIENIPFDEFVTSSLNEDQIERIRRRATCVRNPDTLSDIVYQTELQNSRIDYETMMKKIVFDANMFNLTNISEMKSLSLSPEALNPSNKTVKMGSVNVPEYSLKDLVTKHETDSFLSSLAALRSLQGAVVENATIQLYEVMPLTFEKSQSLDRYDRSMQDVLQSAIRAIKQEWPQRCAAAVKRSMSSFDTQGRYDVGIRNVHDFINSKNPIRPLLDRINFGMGEVLTLMIKKSVLEFAEFIQQLCEVNVTIEGVKKVVVEMAPDSVYKRKVLPPLFSVAFQVTADERVLNQKQMDENKEEIEAFMKSQAGIDGEKCPIKEVPPLMGKTFEYSYSPEAFKASILRVFDTLISEFTDVPHVQKYVMDRIYFPVTKVVPSISADLDFVVEAREKTEKSIDKALEPLETYLMFFRKYETFINIDNSKYITDKVQVVRRDPDSTEIELPVTVNLQQLVKLIDEHQKEIVELEASLPVTPIDCGLFVLEVVSVRNLLLNKHKDIIQMVLTAHAGYCVEASRYIEEEFKKIAKNLAKKPENIELLTELEEYVGGVGNTLQPLIGAINDMMSYYNLLDLYKFKVDVENSNSKWSVFGLPAKVHQKCQEISEQNIAVKRRFNEDMQGEQVGFIRVMEELSGDVEALVELADLSRVEEIAEHVLGVERKLNAGIEKARQFNSREVLFEQDQTDYEELSRLQKNFEPFSFLWNTSKEWLNEYASWIDGKFVDLDAEAVEAKVEKFNIAITKANKFFSKAEMIEQSDIAAKIKKQIADFVPEVPLIVTLRNPGMRDRHWNEISKQLNVEVMPIEEFTTKQILDLNMKDQIALVSKIGESAAKEYQIEKALDKMEAEWINLIISISPYRETGTGVIKGVDEINVVLDEQITMTQTIMFSAFKGPFEERIEEWNKKLCMVSEVLDSWVAVQRSWLYLQPIFESADINRQLPVEGKKFATVDKNWRSTISNAKQNAKVIEFCDNEKLLERFKDSEVLLEQVQKGLSDYLETKRSVFARFYFLSNDELLSILSESKDVQRVQPHLKKCFEGIDKVKFLDDLKIDRIISPENEEIMLSELIDPVDKNVEHWMLELEGAMRISIRDCMQTAIEDYLKTRRPKWMTKWAGMCVLNGSQLHWTREMEELFHDSGEKAPSIMLERQVAQLADMTILVRGKLSSAARTTVGALTVIDVHARDVIKKLVNEKVDTKDNFSWTSQLRYYWDGHDLSAQMVGATRPYGYEYLGNTFRLVITPLTDKCYLTLMGALQMIFGGAPAGPAGTGKTETTKDLAKALAMQCVVFNCSDGLDYLAMGKFFKGLASCGAWACFDEFNRINIEVLSVIGQQIMYLQMAIRAKQPRLNFEGSDIAVSDRFAVYITMNPGYAGRTALPDSLSALFRPVAMMVPDYALIGEIMFFAYGFEFAKECGAKMVTTFKLASEQLSSQPHYDYGMRAVKTVITAAGNLKRAEPDADEMVLLLRALQDVNIPKFLEMDLPLFKGIISDLFPGKVRPQLDYGALMNTMQQVIGVQGLQPIDFFVTKVIQLYEMIVVRHGLMLVGPTGGAKSSNIHVLEQTLGSLKSQGIEGFAYEKVHIFQLNPKSITMGQMYGEVDNASMEWKDGIMSTMYRNATIDTPDRKWMLFDGPVDAIWIENMNTVLDDNKKLCLNSGEIIKMSPEMTMMFEVEDLAVASPATVSRVGIIYMEPEGLGLDVLIQTWISRIPPSILPVLKNKLTFLFDLYLKPSLLFVRTNMKELVPTVDNNLAQSLMRILDCFFEPCIEKEGRDKPTDVMISDMSNCVEPLFLFALVWSVGGVIDESGRKMFDAFLRIEGFNNKTAYPFPKAESVYDYVFMVGTKKWVKWMDLVDKIEVNIKDSFSEIVVPTTDSIRNTYLTDLLMSNGKHTLFVGGTGTGKTVNISQYLMGSSQIPGKVIKPNVIPLTMTFSANTSANMTQDFLDSKMDKRKKGVYGPAAGKLFYVYVDDLNMPKREEYGAQPPIELLRQWFDQDGWYDRKELVYRKIIDLTFIASMGPPGGGRQQITGRFLRHFNIIGYVEMSDKSKTIIFGNILRTFLSNFEAGLVTMTDEIVASSISVFDTIVKELLPTPAKSHYTFNLRDLAKVFQGMLMCDPKKVNSKEKLARLWVHESQRVFGDRLTCEEDHVWLRNLFQKQVEESFKMDWDRVYPKTRLAYGDFMIMGSENRVYDEIEDFDKLKCTVEEYLSEFNGESKQPMPLVLFEDAVAHVVKIARVLRQPQGNALLLGVGGSGRQSMTRLATYVAGYSLATVEIVKGYTMSDWREDLKRILMQAGVKLKQTAFLFSDVQIINERMVEDINNILNSGDVPNLYAPEDMEAISTACRAECQKRKIPATKLNIFAQYVIRVRKNIHLCIAMSPLGEAFRNRLRNYPSLVNCCTIDWFTNWPADALQSVGLSTLKQSKLGLDEHELNTVEMFKEIHMSVERTSVEYYEMLRRKCYVTPTSYLELLSSFAKLIKSKREELSVKRNRLQNGLDKLSETKQMVGIMQEELVELQPVLVKTQQEVADMMVVIEKDKASAAITKANVEVEEASANEKAVAAKAISDDATKDLAEALPALEEAVKCLNDLKKSDIDEIKSLKTPPSGVVLTIKVCCLMFEVKPIKKNDPNTPGKKIEDYWEAGQKGLLTDAKVFIASLINFDKDHIPDKIIKAITPFMDDPAFTPQMIEKASKACTAICMWARAMYKYHFVALGVAPKRAKLEAAEAELAVVMAALAEAKAQLAEVNARLDKLEKDYNEAVEKKDQLEKKEASCKVQLVNADKLVGGLGGEATRWKESVDVISDLYDNVLGDVIVSAGTISYLGPFTSDFRVKMVGEWQDCLKSYGLPHTLGCNLEMTLADPVKVRSWQLCSLPSDSLSTQNAIIIDNGRRWPLLIDPQGQGNRYIRSMSKDSQFAENGMDVVKLSDKNFLRTLENGVQFGRWVLLENILETLDAALEPVLLQQKFKQGGQDMIKIGDNIIPYNSAFRFFLTTKLANPHYAPEVQVKVSLLNFTITVGGLEEQLLGVTVTEELPELAKQKADLVIQNAAMNKQLYDIESEILFLLSNSKGNILDDTVLIETLAQSKVTSEEIKVKMVEAAEIENEILVQSDLYRPVAKRSSLLYFVVADLGDVDPMYQYSLQWFTALFVRGIAAAPPSSNIDTRLASLNDFFTYSLYTNICRSLFERHKLLFSFILCVKILQGDDKIDAQEYRYLLSGVCLGGVTAPKPEADWLELNIWDSLCNMCALDAFRDLADSFPGHIDEWQAVFDSADPHSAKFPKPYEDVTPLQRLCIIRVLRRDKIELCMQDFIDHYLDNRFIQPPPFDLRACYNDSSPTVPLIFVLSSGSDPNKDLDILAEEMNFTDRLKRIALGQGQGKKAYNLIEKGMLSGDWVMLQNCHLSISWMPTLEIIVEGFDPEKLNPEFRLWLTSMPSEAFPTVVLQNGVKITKEPPKGIRANLKSTYLKLDNDKLKRSKKPDEFQKLLFGLSFFHATVVERKKYGPLGWNIPYEFNDTDFDITAAQLELYINEYKDIPYKVFQQLTSAVNYGGRITDDKDMRTSDIIVADFMKPELLTEGYKFSESGIYASIQPDPAAPCTSYLEYIDSLPLTAEPEVFGMHSNASITCAITEADATFEIILTLQPRIVGGKGVSREDQMIEMAKNMHSQLPPLFDVEALSMQYPTDYLESMNTTLVQEAERYNSLLKNMHESLFQVQRALKGLVVLSAELEAMGNAMFDQRVPASWTANAYPSLKPLAAWFKDLMLRLDFLIKWIENGVPALMWVSGFFFPQGFLTAILQNYARKYQFPIDTVSFSFLLMDETVEEITSKAPDGCYIYGLFLEGSRWDKTTKSLENPKPKELFSPMPPMHFLPVQYRDTPQGGIYRCPVYKVLTRTGTLSTTGHSTNFVTWIEIPSNKRTVFRSSLVSETNAQVQFCDQHCWIKAGVACFCALRY